MKSCSKKSSFGVIILTLILQRCSSRELPTKDSACCMACTAVCSTALCWLPLKGWTSKIEGPVATEWRKQATSSDGPVPSSVLVPKLLASVRKTFHRALNLFPLMHPCRHAVSSDAGTLGLCARELSPLEDTGVVGSCLPMCGGHVWQ